MSTFYLGSFTFSVSKVKSLARMWVVHCYHHSCYEYTSNVKVFAKKFFFRVASGTNDIKRGLTENPITGCKTALQQLCNNHELLNAKMATFIFLGTFSLSPSFPWNIICLNNEMKI